MLPRVSIIRREEPAHLPPCPQTTRALAAGCLSRLQESVRRGEKTAALELFQWPDSPWRPLDGTYAVLRAAVEFLYDHPELEQLELHCAGETCWRACRFQWNMWFAETKEAGGKPVTDL